MHTPTVAAITFHPSGGGVAVVAELLWRVIRDQWNGGAKVVEMFHHENRRPHLGEKASFAVTVAGLQLSGRTDWVLFSHLGLARAQRLLPRRLRRPYAVFLHGIEAWSELGMDDRRLLADAQLRLANSEFTARRVMRVHPDIGTVIACPLALLPDETSRVVDVDREIMSSMGPHVVLVVGRMLDSERYKGHDQLIEAWPSVIAQVKDAQLLIVGSGDDSDRLMQKAAVLGLGRSVAFLGFVPRPTLDALYQRAALFALPSRGEGFGLVYLEAMAHRVACLGSVHDAAQEVIVDGVTGLLVSQEHIEGLADAIAELLCNDHKRAAMGAAGYARLNEAFSFQRFSDRLRAQIPDGP